MTAPCLAPEVGSISTMEQRSHGPVTRSATKQSREASQEGGGDGRRVGLRPSTRRRIFEDPGPSRRSSEGSEEDGDDNET